jgi:hypothetical protein
MSIMEVVARVAAAVKLAVISSVFVTFDTDGEVLQALVRCIGVVMDSHTYLEVDHASPDADRTSPT